MANEATDEAEVISREEIVDRGFRVRRLRLLGTTRNFDVDFADTQVYPLSIIAGRTNTGKTSILKFIAYALGASDYPDHTEVIRQVRAVALEIMTADGVRTLERALGSNAVQAFPSSLDEMDIVTSSTYVVDPINAPESLSQFLLSTVDLQDVRLKEAPTKSDSGTDTLGFRDLMWVCLYLNERVGSQQLLHTGNYMKELKLRQVVDAVFGVHDNEQADLARRIKENQTKVEGQRRAVEMLREFVAQQEPQTALTLEVELGQIHVDLATIEERIADLDQREAAAANFASDLRLRHSEAATRAKGSGARVRDRVSLIDRFSSLRAQYADDVRKLTLLVEAETIFDQLSVGVCPACFNPLPAPIEIVDGTCGLCHHDLPVDQTPSSTHGITSDGSTPEEAGDSAVEHARSELRTTKRRAKELDEYLSRLSLELTRLRDTADADADSESETAEALDRATSSQLTPFGAERDELHRRQQAAMVLRSKAVGGIKLLTGLDARVDELARLEKNLERLRREQKSLRDRPDRDSVVATLSTRYSQILHEIQYPKIDEEGVLPPYLDTKLTPYVRGQHFKDASSGGQVLVSLAWMLAVFEIAYETNAAHPGLLMIDTPQKNLGGKADSAEYADIHLVERFYEHVTSWLIGAGAGAQVIIVDNTPPDAEESHVIVRYTRDPLNSPFGLIDNETGLKQLSE